MECINPNVAAVSLPGSGAVNVTIPAGAKFISVTSVNKVTGYDGDFLFKPWESASYAHYGAAFFAIHLQTGVIGPMPIPATLDDGAAVPTLYRFINNLANDSLLWVYFWR